MTSYSELKRSLYIRTIHFKLSRKKYCTSKSLIIFSEARGGSTWLLQLLANIPGVIINWEPLHKLKGIVPDEFNWGWRPMIHPNNDREKCINFLKDTLSFGKYNSWTTKLINIRDIGKSQIVLTKFVRANRLIPFILDNLNFDNKPIFLLRHPIDVCSSQIKAFHSNSNFIDKYKVLESIQLDHLNNDQKLLLKKLESPLEFKIFIWCYNNSEIFKNHINDSRLIVIYYELLLLNPHEYISEILNEWKIYNKDEVLKSLNFDKASKTDYNAEFINNPKKQLLKNLRSLDHDQSIRIQDIFNVFEFTIYNAFEAYPTTVMSEF